MIVKVHDCSYITPNVIRRWAGTRHYAAFRTSRLRSPLRGNGKQSYRFTALQGSRGCEVAEVARVLRDPSGLLKPERRGHMRKKAKEKLVRVGIQVPPEVKQRWEALAEENVLAQDLIDQKQWKL